MSRRRRCGLMLAAVAGLLAFYVWGATGLRDFGADISQYGKTINSAVSSERQVTNAVSAVNFDYRAFDTMGEELILFISVVGVALLLREQRTDDVEVTREAENAELTPRGSDAVRALGAVAVGATLLVGLYVVAHGNLTPGGGFQGGVILGAAFTLLYSAGNFTSLRRLQPAPWMDVLHATGAAGLVLLGLGGLLAGGAFFHNFLGTGTSGLLQSGGTIELGNVAVGLEVTGASVLLGAELLHAVTVGRGRSGA